MDVGQRVVARRADTRLAGGGHGTVEGVHSGGVRVRLDGSPFTVFFDNDEVVAEAVCHNRALLGWWWGAGGAPFYAAESERADACWLFGPMGPCLLPLARLANMAATGLLVRPGGRA